jgi:hypothetical protein
VEQPVLEITADDAAAIVRGPHRYEMRGPDAAAVIRAYRHLATHQGTGAVDAALYLWGVIDGLRYAALAAARRETDTIKARHPEPG